MACNAIFLTILIIGNIFSGAVPYVTLGIGTYNTVYMLIKSTCKYFLFNFYENIKTNKVAVINYLKYFTYEKWKYKKNLSK